ncbi:MAG: MATE family efflux transporter [Butyricicoccus sp.]|nr:MATE family efflux transporter [Butyricicoccus sp.]
MDTRNFASTSVPRTMVKFIMPTVLSQLVTLLYNLADTFFVGHTNDPNQMAALTLSFPIFMILTAIGNLMGIGANSLIARSLGIGDRTQARKAGLYGVYGGVLLAALFSLVMALSMRPVLALVGASDNTYAYTASYLQWTVVVGGIPTVTSLVLGHLVRAEGNTRQASIGMSLGGVLNILLDPVLIMGAGLGITGATIATAFSNCVAMLYFLFVLYRNRKQSVLTLDGRHVGLDFHVVTQIVLIGIPAALVVLLGSTANIVLTHYMAPYGDINVAAFGVVQKIGTVTIQITMGITQGVMPLIGYHFGAGDHARTREICRDTFIILAVYAAACLLIIEAFPTQMIRIFTTEADTIAVGTLFLKCWIVCTPGMCFVNLFNTIFQAMGKWQPSLFLSLFRQALLLIPLLIVLDHTVGLYGLVWSQPVSDTCALLLGIVLYRVLLKKTA